LRPELQQLRGLRASIGEHEIPFTVEICSQIVQSHWQATHKRFEAYPEDCEDQEYIESLSDQNFRTAYQVRFIWHLALWRVQALFEGILSDWFPETERLPIMKKLQLLEKTGVLSSADFAQLAQWIELRNVFSHRPPESPSFSHDLTRDDLDEFAGLIGQVLTAARPHVQVPISEK
jgi:hypothetical protein